MKRQWSLVALVALAVGCDAVLGINAGIPMPEAPPAAPPPTCTVDTDCKVDEPACRSVIACTEGKCLFDDVSDGIAIPEQTAGDCGEWVCNGEGETRWKDVSTDAPDDGNDCTQDTCSGSMPVHTMTCSCGDGKTTAALGEECDDGNTSDDDDCLTTCKRPHVLQVVAGSYHTCALLPGGVVKCWGGNDYGQLGLGHKENIGDDAGEMGAILPAVDLGTAQVAVAIAAGYYHTCALLSSGNVKCWGKNDKGQLGQGDTNNRGDEPGEMGDKLQAIDLGTGGNIASIGGNGVEHVCALTTYGRVKCWGSNWHGRLGLGDKSDEMTEKNRGDSPNEMGNNLPYVDLGMNVNVEQLAVGAADACVLLPGGTVKCWGHGFNGTLASGNKLDRGDEPGEMGGALPAVDIGMGLTASSVESGGGATCAIVAPDGKLKCWGWGWQGLLGLGESTHRGDGPNEMGNDLPFVDLGTGKYAKMQRISNSHMCTLLTDGTIKCWGTGSGCKLGFEAQGNIGDEPGEMGDNLPVVNLGANRIPTAITVGAGQSCALLSSGAVTCWGSNYSGELGLGNNSMYQCPGDNLPTVKLFSNEW